MSKMDTPDLSVFREALGRDLHFFQRDGKWIAFGSVSGVILALNDVETFALQEFIRGNEIKDICQANSITIEDFFGLLKETFLRIGKRSIIEETLQPVKSLLLIVTNACNMACTYCYGGYGISSRKSHMSINTARRCIRVARELGIDQISFFGGEPLLNFNAIKEAICFAEKMDFKIQYGMTTNATLVTEKIADFCQKHKISVSVSLDGPESIHNLTRQYPDGSGTFKDVKKGIEQLARHNILSCIEVTYSMKHPPSLEDTIYQLRSLCNRITVSCVEGPKNAVYHEEVVRGNRLKNYYDDLFSLFIQEPVKSNFFVYGIEGLLETLASDATVHRDYICSGVMRRITVSPDGKLYPCPETMKPCFCLGSVWDDSIAEKLENSRENVLQGLSKKGRTDNYWFSNIVDTCYVRIRTNKYGDFSLDDASTFSDCMEDLIARIVSINPKRFTLNSLI